MLLEPDRFRHTPPIAPERSHAPPRPSTGSKDVRPTEARNESERQDKPSSSKG